MYSYTAFPLNVNNKSKSCNLIKHIYHKVLFPLQKKKKKKRRRAPWVFSFCSRSRLKTFEAFVLDLNEEVIIIIDEYQNILF